MAKGSKESKKILNTGWKLENSYARLPGLFFTLLMPTPVKEPNLVLFNKPLAISLGLDPKALHTKEGLAILAGNKKAPGSTPLAQAYAGHQFGYFTLLGDGRAHLLGEQVAPCGERFDIQLKGSGRTPYSRHGDGRAPLGPMLREYIISEAMHFLGIPTSRSLAVVTTGEQVVRTDLEKGAVLTRVAQSHLRVGTFEYASHRGTEEDLKVLADYTIKRHYSQAYEQPNPYLALLEEVIKGQAALIVKWQLVGFIHGVMNTDNMALSGETIDYGPCAFMDSYDPDTVFSSIDRHGRYSYGNQPSIAAWNLARFAESLLPLLAEDEKKAIDLAQGALADFFSLYREAWLGGMRKKLGLFSKKETDATLFDDLLKLMQKHRADYTNTFYALTSGQAGDEKLFTTAEFRQWQERWQKRLKGQKESEAVSRRLMAANNPTVIPRNRRVDAAIRAATDQDDYTDLKRLLAVLTKPYDYCHSPDNYYTKPDQSTEAYRTFCGT